MFGSRGANIGRNFEGRLWSELWRPTLFGILGANIGRSFGGQHWAKVGGPRLGAEVGAKVRASRSGCQRRGAKVGGRVRGPRSRLRSGARRAKVGGQGSGPRVQFPGDRPARASRPGCQRRGAKAGGRGRGPRSRLRSGAMRAKVGGQGFRKVLDWVGKVSDWAGKVSNWVGKVPDRFGCGARVEKFLSRVGASSLVAFRRPVRTWSGGRDGGQGCRRQAWC